tara:strand:- start:144 stop:563 length:420 start_codon:yes stop_codon:yes gene_type:complete
MPEKKQNKRAMGKPVKVARKQTMDSAVNKINLPKIARRQQAKAADKKMADFIKAANKVMAPPHEQMRSASTTGRTRGDMIYIHKQGPMPNNPSSGAGRGTSPRYEGTPNTAETVFETQSAPRRAKPKLPDHDKYWMFPR